MPLSSLQNHTPLPRWRPAGTQAPPPAPPPLPPRLPRLQALVPALAQSRSLWLSRRHCRLLKGCGWVEAQGGVAVDANVVARQPQISKQYTSNNPTRHNHRNQPAIRT